MPHAPAVLQRGGGACGSLWPRAATGEALYAVVNRGSRPLAGAQLSVPAGGAPGTRFFDCYRGVELRPGGEPASRERLERRAPDTSEGRGEG